MEFKFLALIFVGLNILPVFGLSQDCANIKKFLNRYYSSSFTDDDCCEFDTKDNYQFDIGCDSSENIVKLSLTFSKGVSGGMDFTSFNNFKKLEELEIDGDVFSNKMLSNEFFKLPNLKKLKVRQTYKIPEQIETSSPVEEITLDDNGITKFPYIFKNLKKLKSLSLKQNQIDGTLTDEIKKFPALEKLDISQNKFEGELIIPDKLKSLDISDNKFNKYSTKNSNSVLEEFNGSNNDIGDDFLEEIATIKSLKQIKIQNLSKITKLPNTIFNLTNVEEFDISKNPNLYVKIVNFGLNDTEPVKHCNFLSTNIVCYQENTCSNDKDYKFKACTEKEINSIKYGMDETSSAFASFSLNKIYLIVSLLSLILLF